uniref:Uncharacterized protein n=1 Tax=Arundo donax TaxID=35708 RepID=A0A0A9E4M9_ARUDO
MRLDVIARWGRRGDSWRGRRIVYPLGSWSLCSWGRRRRG